MSSRSRSPSKEVEGERTEEPSKRKPSPIRAPDKEESAEKSDGSLSPRRDDDDRRRRRRSDSRDNRDRRRRDRSDSRDRRRRDRSGSRDLRRRRSRSDSEDRRRSKRGRRDDSPRRDRRRSRSKSPAERRRSATPKKDEEKEKEAVARKEPVDDLRSRAGGAYIPPAKLRMMQEQMMDKGGEQYQRVNWERMKKRINGEVNKVNVANLVSVVRALLQENIVRGKGILCRSIMQAQAFSPGFTHVYAGLVAVINSKFPFIGELLVRRLVVQFKRCFRRGDKTTTIIVTKFIAHLVNQQVMHEIVGLEIALLMLDKPTDDSVEVATAFIKECGAKLNEVAPRALQSVFDRLRSILVDSEELENRTKYIIEASMAIQKDKFAAYPAVQEDLDLIEEEDQITHMVTLEDAQDPENMLNVFKMDPDFDKTEAEYEEVRKEVIGDADDSDDDEEDDDGQAEDDDDDDERAEQGGAAKKAEPMEIIDNTEQSLVAFRREVYLTIQSSLDFQEAAHKLLKMQIKPQLESELCNMLVDCCAQQRTYERFYGMLIERFCRLKREFQMTFEQIIRDAYKTIHRFDITKLRNVARLAAHLLQTDAIDWNIFSEVRLNERDTTSSGRIFLREVFQELSREMGMVKLYERTVDKTLRTAFAGVFPRDNPEDTRFAVNFFTIIGLGALSLDMRDWLDKGMAKKKKKEAAEDTDSSSSSDSSDSDSSDSDSDSDSDSSDSSSSSDSEDEKKKKKKKKHEKSAKKVKEGKESHESVKENRHEIKREPDSEEERDRRRDRDADKRRDTRRDERDERRGEKDDRGGREDRESKRSRDKGDERKKDSRRDDSREKRGSDRDVSPPKKGRDRDASPDRRGRDREDSPDRRGRDRKGSPDRRGRDRDGSPDRRGRDRDGSPDRRDRDRDEKRGRERGGRGDSRDRGDRDRESRRHVSPAIRDRRRSRS